MVSFFIEASPRVVLRKTCSVNMQHVEVSKCDLNKVAKQLWRAAFVL